MKFKSSSNFHQASPNHTSVPHSHWCSDTCLVMGRGDGSSVYCRCTLYSASLLNVSASICECLFTQGGAVVPRKWHHHELHIISRFEYPKTFDCSAPNEIETYVWGNTPWCLQLLESKQKAPCCTKQNTYYHKRENEDGDKINLFNEILE